MIILWKMLPNGFGNGVRNNEAGAAPLWAALVFLQRKIPPQ